MNDMIKRVADAIDEAIGKAGGWDDGCADMNAVARAAIKAMRQPTDEMISASPEEGVAWNQDSRDRVKLYWQSMIDAALSTPDPK